MRQKDRVIIMILCGIVIIGCIIAFIALLPSEGMTGDGLKLRIESSATQRDSTSTLTVDVYLDYNKINASAKKDNILEIDGTQYLFDIDKMSSDESGSCKLTTQSVTYTRNENETIEVSISVTLNYDDKDLPDEAKELSTTFTLSDKTISGETESDTPTSDKGKDGAENAKNNASSSGNNGTTVTTNDSATDNTNNTDNTTTTDTTETTTVNTDFEHHYNLGNISQNRFGLYADVTVTDAAEYGKANVHVKLYFLYYDLQMGDREDIVLTVGDASTTFDITGLDNDEYETRHETLLLETDLTVTQTAAATFSVSIPYGGGEYNGVKFEEIKLVDAICCQ